MDISISLIELLQRKKKFISLMDQTNPMWETAIIHSNVNQYYFTGTIQDGIIVIKKDGSTFYFVRKSYERAKNESVIDNLFQINSYKDISKYTDINFGNTFIETNNMSISMLERLEKHLTIKNTFSLDKLLLTQRSVKSEFELKWILESGKSHYKLMNEVIPTLIKEGINEAEFSGEIYSEMIKLGFQGISRFSNPQTEMVVGQIGFGVNSTYPTSFDGPGGSRGLYPASPILGDRNTTLTKGDLVFVDIAFGINGYHSDKTQIYMYEKTPSAELMKAHEFCIDIQNKIINKLIPGAIPSEVYNEIISEIPNEYKYSFMGYKNHLVKFLGHGVGLLVDEYPVIANGFNQPIKENMVVSIEPKISFENIGMVGCEETFVIKEKNNICVTGGPKSILIV